MNHGATLRLSVSASAVSETWALNALSGIRQREYSDRNGLSKIVFILKVQWMMFGICELARQVS